ncbi:peptidoglycan D,D-transpeptidase FtsI family protein [Desulfofalx alkaliphila]|uniref:peptidoglycan D,D-transpeptidase FtsI family protein n=1 Tax=Desulfofalx alkaliphila TaxID=105483 RepID=UPI0004E11A54|nr:penicillin-binding transpeptidase domain-containing protein [Desulfofalx alkaliphila]
MDIKGQKRLVLTFYLLIILFLPLVAQLADVQLAKGPEYARRALEQRSITVVLEDLPRGDILDRNLISLTGSEQQERVIVFPSLMELPLQVAEELASILNVDAAEIVNDFSSGSGVLSYPLEKKQIRMISERNWPGVMVLPVYQRYLNQPLAVHLIGHLGKIPSQEALYQLTAESEKQYQLNDLVGKMGLEKHYEHYLKGTGPEHSVRAFADASGSVLSGMGFKIETNGVDRGRNHLVTTIDYNIQRIVEEVMDEQVEQGAVVVMDVRTGDIVAMASRPNFHPAEVADLLETAPPDTFIDHCTALYQPGSIFKIVVAAAALEEGLVSPDSTFVCLGEKAPYVSCWHKPGHGLISFSQAFADSCNPAFAELGLKLGAEKIIEYAIKLGMDKQTIIGYPVIADIRQDLSAIAQPYNLTNCSIGQGPVLVTPVQLSSMVNTIVNDGTYLPPRLVRELRKSDGTVNKRFPPGNSYKAISADTAKQLRELLALTVEEGVGQKAMVAHYGSAGKTGSAEVAGQNGVNAWFVGYSPKDNPRYVTAVLVKDGVSGGETAGPVFREVMEQILGCLPLTR